MTNLIDFTGKVALITGASSGIGAATAVLFGELGATVAIGFHSNRTGAEQVQKDVRSKGGRAEIFQCDVSKASEIESLFAEVSRTLGPVDILINNAGSLLERLPLPTLTEDRWDAVMDLNLKSAVLCSRAAAASMVERKQGAIVNMASIAGHNGGGPGAGPYAAAKAGLAAFTKSLAKELAPHGVRANSVSPGVIDTPFHEVFSTPEMMQNFTKQIPLGRVGTPLECAKAIAFMASDAASYITGETLEVNGGQLMR